MPRVFTDQMQREVTLLRYPPERIVSLVPSQTELLAWLGLEDCLVGITKFCVHPESVYRSVARVGGTKQVHLDRIDALYPDLIIGNKEENTREQIEFMEKHYPVWMSDIHTLDDALGMIRLVGELTDRSEKAQELALRIETDFAALPQGSDRPIDVGYVIWNNPLMVAGADTFIDHLLGRAGFRNVFGNLGRYPEVTEAQLTQASPEVLLLSSEPFPFQEKHIDRFKRICPNAVTILVNGELFSWYGSRLLQSAAYFRNLRTFIFSAIKEL